MKVTGLHRLLIWRDSHLCPPVVLFGDGLISFLTRRVPANKTKTRQRETITHYARRLTVNATKMI